jgi:nucleotide-binding universal stress UspA family protein
MSKPILVGHDPKADDRAPVRFGVAAARLTGAPLIAASVQAGAPILPLSAQTLEYAVAQKDEDLVSDCSAALAEVEAELGDEGIQFECRKLRGTTAARALYEEAEKIDAGLLVVGSRRKSIAERIVLGSTAERLIHGAPCPVGVVPPGWTAKGDLATIGVAYINSDEALDALRGAWALAERSGASLRVFTIVKPGLTTYLEAEARNQGRFGKSAEDAEGEHLLMAEREVKAALARLDGDVAFEVEGLIGDPAEILIRLSESVDLLVCGSRGYGPLRAVLLGSVTRRVATEAHCPVIVLPRGVKASLEALVAETPGATAAA